MLVQSYLLFIPIGYGPTMQMKCLEIWLHLSLQSGSWGVGASESWRCPRAHFVVVYICLMHMIWVFFECWEVYLRGLKVCRLHAFDLTVLNVQGFLWELWRCLDSNSTLLERLECWETYLKVLDVFRLYNIWLEYFERSRVSLRALKVYRLK